MPNLSWPQAFVLVFGVLPASVLLLAAACTDPLVVLPLLGIASAAVVLARREARLSALAERCAAEYPSAAALVAQPLPDLPTAPMRRSLR